MACSSAHQIPACGGFSFSIVKVVAPREGRNTQRPEEARRTAPQPAPRRAQAAKLRSRLLTFSDLAAKVSEDKSNYRMPTLKAKFGTLAAEEIKPSQIKDWLKEQHEWSLVTKNRYIALMKLTYGLAEEAQKVKYNPARLVRQLKENNSRIRWLTDDEETKLRAAIPSEHVAEFGLHTGMRKSEHYEKAVWENVDFTNNLLKIPDPKQREARYVRLNSRMQAVLAMLKTTPALGRIMALQSPRGWFEQAVKDSGIAHFTWPDLRHTFISRLVMAAVALSNCSRAGWTQDDSDDDALRSSRSEPRSDGS